jgi:hypothetical protein
MSSGHGPGCRSWPSGASRHASGPWDAAAVTTVCSRRRASCAPGSASRTSRPAAPTPASRRAAGVRSRRSPPQATRAIRGPTSWSWRGSRDTPGRPGDPHAATRRVRSESGVVLVPDGLPRLVAGEQPHIALMVARAGTRVGARRAAAPRRPRAAERLPADQDVGRHDDPGHRAGPRRRSDARGGVPPRGDRARTPAGPARAGAHRPTLRILASRTASRQLNRTTWTTEPAGDTVSWCDPHAALTGTR